MKKPLLSFSIPTYNRANRVYECVTRILSYPCDEIEVVVSDNASTDNTLKLLGTIADKRLRVYTNEKNILGLNWPLAVSRATGRFAALMSDEDIVCIENVPFFLNLLEQADLSDIGVVTYNFYPASPYIFG
ncbi:MAG: glycosyltransferase, partial [Chitinispirillia bacterium]|nr:glycosyltransferase [Chitinispirillia bacterium]